YVFKHPECFRCHLRPGEYTKLWDDVFLAPGTGDVVSVVLLHVHGVGWFRGWQVQRPGEGPWERDPSDWDGVERLTAGEAARLLAERGEPVPEDLYRAAFGHSLAREPSCLEAIPRPGVADTPGVAERRAPEWDGPAREGPAPCPVVLRGEDGHVLILG